MKQQINQIAQELMQDFLQEVFPVGTLLPSEKELEARFECNRHSIYYALNKLQEAGIVERRKKGGTRLLRLPRSYEMQFMRNAVSQRIVLLNHFTARHTYSVVHYNERLINSLRQHLNSGGLELEIHDTPPSEDPEECREFLQPICQAGCQALVLISGNKISHFSEMLFQMHNRIFIFNRGAELFDDDIVNQVAINNFADGVTAATAALGHGAKQLIFCSLGNFENQTWLNERRRGVSYGAYRFLNAPFFCDNFIYGLHGKFPLKAPSPRTTLIAANDEVAARHIAEGNKLGLVAGKDYKIIGFGDDERFRELGITTLSPDLETIGEQLARGIISANSVWGDKLNFSCNVKSKLIRRKTL